MNDKPIRQSNFELLRIVAMVLIIFHHFSNHSGVTYTGDILTLNRFWMDFLYMWGKVGVNAFVLISGYFLAASDSFSWKKTFKLWWQAWVYVIIGLFIGLVILHVEIPDRYTLFKNIFPFILGKWWFFTSYLFLYIASPFINKLISTLDQKKYRRLLVFLTCFLVGVLFIRSYAMPWTDLPDNFCWFIYLYLLAGYVKIYGDLSSKLTGKWIYIFIVSAVAAYAYWVLRIIAGSPMERLNYFSINHPFVFLMSISLFMSFKELKIPCSNTINLLGAATFGVYLFHDNNLLRSYMWLNIFHVADLAESKYLIPYTFLVTVIVFAVGFLLNLLYKKTLAKVGDKIWRVLEKAGTSITKR